MLGIVRAPFLTTLMQVASRFLLVWGIAYNFPQTTAHSAAFSTMLLAWSFTEVVRYSYFVFTLSGVGVPRLWTWLRYVDLLCSALDIGGVLTQRDRYNTFMVHYPLGISSECWLVYQAIAPASQIDERLGYALWAILAIYVPGSYILFTHMLKQRRRIQKSA